MIYNQRTHSVLVSLASGGATSSLVLPILLDQRVSNLTILLCFGFFLLVVAGQYACICLAKIVLVKFFKKWMNEREDRDREAFMQGFRKGFPLVGEPEVEQSYQHTKAYKRGLKAGKKSYTAGIPYNG